MLDDVWLGVDAINTVLKKYGLSSLSVDRYLEIFTFPVIDYYRLLGFDFSKNPFEVVGTEFIEEYTRRQLEPSLHDDAHKTMDRIHRAGITQSLLTAATQHMVDTLVDHHGIHDRFIRVIGQDNHYAYGKEEAGRKWIDSLHVGPHEVCFIGDTIHDYDVAKSMGADCILISRGHTSHSRLCDTGAPVFRSLKDFTDSLLGKEEE